MVKVAGVDEARGQRAAGLRRSLETLEALGLSALGLLGMRVIGYMRVIRLIRV